MNRRGTKNGKRVQVIASLGSQRNFTHAKLSRPTWEQRTTELLCQMVCLNLTTNKCATNDHITANKNLALNSIVGAAFGGMFRTANCKSLLC